MPLIQSTPVLYRLANTRSGLRRILKRKGSVVEYLKQAVETGIYRTEDELQEYIKLAKDTDDVSILNRRFRQDIVRGSAIHDYPLDYLIIRNNPPLPDPPHIPFKLREKLQNQQKNLYRNEQRRLSLLSEQQRLAEEKSQVENSTSLFNRRKRRDNVSDTFGNSSRDRINDLIHLYIHHYDKKDTNLFLSNGSSNNNTSTENGNSTGGIGTITYNDTSDKKTFTTQQEYYESLLQVNSLQTNKRNRTMQLLMNQSSYVQRAYDAAITHFQIERESYHRPSHRPGGVGIDTTLSNDDIMKQVDELIASKSTADYYSAKNNYEQTIKEQELYKQKQQDNKKSASTNISTDNINDATATATSTSITSMSPVVVHGMIRWGNRLQNIPYIDWTVGASTALDHWIARCVLQISESTWSMCLEGSTTDPYYLEIGKTIVATREALFPETNVKSIRHINDRNSTDDNDINEIDYNDNNTSSSSSNNDNITIDSIDKYKVSTINKSIDELLASLGSALATTRIDDTAATTTTSTTTTTDTSSGWKRFTPTNTTIYDDEINKLYNELQVWRGKVHNVTPKRTYDTWTRSEQIEFDYWLKGFINVTLQHSNHHDHHNNNTGGTPDTNQVDYDSTRIALLEQPPITIERSNEFWDTLSDVELASELVTKLRNDPTARFDLADDTVLVNDPSTKYHIPLVTNCLSYNAIWDTLTEDEQIERLLNLGSVRPLLDEYMDIQSKNQFMVRYGQLLLNNVPVEYLVTDKHGPISANELPDHILFSMKVNVTDRFRMVVRPYNSQPTYVEDGSTIVTNKLDETTVTATDYNSTGDTEDANDNNDESVTTMTAEEKSRYLYLSWNQFKAGRARYEEMMFQTGRLGIRYGDPNISILDDYIQRKLYREEQKQIGKKNKNKKNKNKNIDTTASTKGK